MSASPFFTSPIAALQRLGWIGMGDSRVFMMDALSGFYSIREQIVQEIGPEAEADMMQRAGFAGAERLVGSGRDSGELTSDEGGFHKALALLSLAGYGQFRATEVRFHERWARVVAEGSVEGWMFREAGTRPTSSCDFTRGMLAGIMHFLSLRTEDVEAPQPDVFGGSSSADTGAGTEISCVETNCIAAAEEFCQFVLGPSSLLIADGLAPASMAHSSVRETLLRLNRQLEQILDSSRKDPLTKLYNRSFFESALRQRIGYAKRRSDVVSLAIIDIDYFKSINDTHGHTVGDRVLRQIARSLEQQARENDIVSRLGGDEFVWLMPATGGDAALAVAQRLRRTIEELTPTIGFTISASIGVANYPQDAGSPGDLFERADSALFTAKRAGRDRALRYSPTPDAHAKPAPAQTANGNGNGAHSTAHPAETPAALDSEPQSPKANRTRTSRSAVKPRRGRRISERDPDSNVALNAFEPVHRARPPRAVELDPATEEAFPSPRLTIRLKKVRY